MESRELEIPASLKRLLNLPALKWAPAALVVILGAALRLWALSNVVVLKFDERYYVPQAWALMRRGYEANYSIMMEFAKKHGGFKTEYVDSAMHTIGFNSHPPLGKWLISGGMYLFGPENPFGWRFTAALFGIAMIILTMVVAYQLFRSIAWSTFAGFLIAVDGVAVVMSRTAQLDIFVATFMLAGVSAVIADRHRERRRVDGWLAARPDFTQPYQGLAVFSRPWLILAAVLFGAGMAVKTTGVVFLALFLLYVVGSDWTHRSFLPRRDRIKAVAASVGKALTVTLPTVIVTWVLSWTGLFASGKVTNPFGWFRYWFEAWTHDSKITSSHFAASQGWTWFLPLKPSILFDVNNFDKTRDVKKMWILESMTLGNPGIWWIGLVALLACLVIAIWKRQHAAIVIVLGVAAGWVPWLILYARTVYHFYTIIFVAFVVLAVTFCARALAVRLASRKPISGRKAARYTIAAYLALVFSLMIYFLPMTIGSKMTGTEWQQKRWIHTWYYSGKDDSNSSSDSSSSFTMPTSASYTDL